MSQPALDAAPEDREVARLQREIRGLEHELEDAKAAVEQLRRMSADAAHAIRALRKLLDPWHMAIKMIYGELDRVQVETASAQNGEEPPARNQQKWTVIMERLGGKQAEFIGLLQSGSMTGPQLKAASKCATKTLYDTIHKLKSAGFILKNGDLYSLRNDS